MKEKWQSKFVKIVICLIMLGALVVMVNVPVLASEKVTLRYWTPWGGMWQEMQQEIVDKFNKTHPNIKVELVHVSWTGFRQKLMTSVAAGSPPDVSTIFGSSNMAPFAAQGILTPLDLFLEGDPELNPENVYAGAWNQGIYKGEKYGLSYGGGSSALLWGKKTFREVGLDPERAPKTFTELSEYSEKLFEKDEKGRVKRIGILPWASMWGWDQNWFYIFGGKHYDPETDKMSVDSPENIEALQWMVNYVNKYGGADEVFDFQQSLGEQPVDLFLSGMESMRFQHSWYLSYIHKYSPDFEYGVAPLPVYGKPSPEKAPMLGADGIIMPLGIKHREEAWTFMRWMATEGETIWTEMQVLNALRRDANVKLRWPDYVPHGVLQTYNDVLLRARPPLDIPIVNILTDRMTAEADKALRNQESAEQALKNVQKFVEKAWEEAKKG